jgi:hypothetical protein
MKQLGFLLLLALLVSGCTTTSHFSAVQDDVKITVGKTSINGTMPLDGTLSRTTFGRYPIKIIREGYEPIYGNLPLKVSPGIIVLDALLFAPAAFYNVQGSLPYYEFDMDKGIIRYRLDENSDWLIYSMSPEQQLASRTFFGD